MLRRYSLIVIIKPGHVTCGQSFVLPIMLQSLMVPPIGLVRYLHEFETLPVVHCPGRLHQVAWGSGALEKEKKAPLIAVLKSVFAACSKLLISLCTTRRSGFSVIVTSRRLPA